ncbi:MAG: L-aspartate oxidase, partial [Flavobacteriaceae bacterium]
MYSDVLVIGSGIAGLSYAIELAEQRPDLNIVIISKREVFESNTKYAQGGIAVVQN